jgi:hypothetical protein
MTQSQLREPIDTAQLGRHARPETALPAVIRPDEAARHSETAATEPPDNRKSLLKMFQKFFAAPHAVH